LVLHTLLLRLRVGLDLHRVQRILLHLRTLPELREQALLIVPEGAEPFKSEFPQAV
jgi:hypothetical protein